MDRQRPDGSFFDAEAGVGGYYKVPYALAVCGYMPQAMRMLNWVRNHHLTSDGDFRAASRRARNPVFDDWPTYANAWLIQGSHRLGRFDLSFPGAAFLLKHQVGCGGFRAFEQGRPYLECVGTSWSGMAQLTVGNLESAGAAIKCLQRLVAQQPDPQRFFFRMTTEGELLTNVPEEQALSHYVDATRSKQIYFQPGIAMIFLCRYHLATGDDAALSAARTIFDFSRRCREDVYGSEPSGKMGMGCALLASITGDGAARDAAGKVAEFLMARQTDEGCWHFPDEDVYKDMPDKRDPELTMDITAEFTAFLCEIASVLGG